MRLIVIHDAKVGSIPTYPGMKPASLHIPAGDRGPILTMGITTETEGLRV